MEFVYWKLIWRVVVIRQTPRVEIFDSKIVVLNKTRRYRTEILPIRRKTLYNQSINQSINQNNLNVTVGTTSWKTGIFTLTPDGIWHFSMWFVLMMETTFQILNRRFRAEILSMWRKPLNNSSVFNRGVWKRACNVILS